MKKVNERKHLEETIHHLQEALDDWNKIPDDAECEMDAFKRKTRELLNLLSNQIRDLDL
jgi:hypothetical protein